jgi:hypothetical protein
MRALMSVITIVLVVASEPRFAQAQQGGSCKQCSEQRRACMSGYSGKTCQTEYERCMKNCQRK